MRGARKIVHDALKQCQGEKLNPAAVAQVLGENAVMLMIRNFGPEAGTTTAPRPTSPRTDSAPRGKGRNC